MKCYFFGLADRSELIKDSETEGRRVLAGSRVSRGKVVFFSGWLVALERALTYSLSEPQTRTQSHGRIEYISKVIQINTEKNDLNVFNTIFLKLF